MALKNPNAPSYITLETRGFPLSDDLQYKNIHMTIDKSSHLSLGFIFTKDILEN